MLLLLAICLGRCQPALAFACATFTSGRSFCLFIVLWPFCTHIASPTVGLATPNTCCWLLQCGGLWPRVGRSCPLRVAPNTHHIPCHPFHIVQDALALLPLFLFPLPQCHIVSVWAHHSPSCWLVGWTATASSPPKSSALAPSLFVCSCPDLASADTAKNVEVFLVLFWATGCGI